MFVFSCNLQTQCLNHAEVGKVLQNMSSRVPRHVVELKEEVTKISKIVKLVKPDLAKEFEFYAQIVRRLTFVCIFLLPLCIG